MLSKTEWPKVASQPRDRRPIRVLFYRDYDGPNGGHYKLRDYILHTGYGGRYVPQLFLEDGSRQDGFWDNCCERVASFDPHSADILFVAGLDWLALDAFPDIEHTKPVINLIQGVRHADPVDPRFAFLGRRAVRICVSESVADAIAATGLTAGPIVTIPIGQDLPPIPVSSFPKYDVFVAAAKNPRLGDALANRLKLKGLAVFCAERWMDRVAFLTGMASSRIAVTLPLAQEGFFLPALEAMQLGCAVVCPDCVGNRHFCRDGETAIVPPYNLESLEHAAMQLVDDDGLAQRIALGGRNEAASYSLPAERDRYLKLLDKIAQP